MNQKEGKGCIGDHMGSLLNGWVRLDFNEADNSVTNNTYPNWHIDFHFWMTCVATLDSSIPGIFGDPFQQISKEGKAEILPYNCIR